MRENRHTPDSNYSDADDEYRFDDQPSRLKSVIFFALCAMLVLSTVIYGAVDAWVQGLLAIFAGSIALLWLADSFFRRSFGFSSNVIQLPLIGLFAIGVIQLLPLGGADISGDLLSIPAVASLSLDPYATRFFLVQLGIYIVFFAACLTLLENQKRQRIMVFTIIIFSSLMAFFGIIQSLTNTNPNTILGMRENLGSFPFATFVNRHHFAALMNMVIGLTLGLLYGNSTKRDKRLLLIISLILMGIAMMFTGSRGGFLSLFGVVGVVVLLNLIQGKTEQNDDDGKRKSFKLQKNFLLIGSGLLLIAALIGSASFFGGADSVVRGIGLGEQSNVSTGRAHFWNVAAQIFLHNPILGAGLDAFGAAFTKYDDWNGFFRVEQAHNEYLQVAAEAGILGIVCLASFIYLLIRQGLRIVSRSDDRFRRGTAIGALAGCVGILIHSFFDFPLRTSSNALFFLTLVSLATISTYSSPPPRKRKKMKAESEVKFKAAA